MRRPLKSWARVRPAAIAVVLVAGYLVLMPLVTYYCTKYFGWRSSSLAPLFLLGIVLPYLLGKIIVSSFKRPPIPPGHCQNCGYDLTGNVSGRCSECGSDFDVLVICEKCERRLYFPARLRGSVQTCPHCGDRSEVPFVAGYSVATGSAEDQRSQRD